MSLTPDIDLGNKSHIMLNLYFNPDWQYPPLPVDGQSAKIAPNNSPPFTTTIVKIHPAILMRFSRTNVYLTYLPYVYLTSSFYFTNKSLIMKRTREG